MKRISKKSIDDAFSLIVSKKESGELRPKQIELAKNIASALNKHNNFIGQGSTGIGKTYAYLVPAILSDEWILISTATKHLSTQLVENDLKFLSQIFNGLKYAQLKGAGNYICPAKAQVELDDFNLSILNSTNEAVFADDYIKLRDDGVVDDYTLAILWVLNMSDSGNNEPVYIDQCPHSLKAQEREKLVPNSIGCTQKCEFAENFRCPMANTLIKAQESKILVTTHANVASWIKNEEGMGILGAPNDENRGIWIADEAHELERTLEDSWSAVVSASTLEDNLKGLEIQNNFLKSSNKTSGISKSDLDRLREHANKLVLAIEAGYKAHEKPSSSSRWKETTAIIRRLDHTVSNEIEALLSILAMLDDRLKTALHNSKDSSESMLKNLRAQIRRFVELLATARVTNSEDNPRVMYYSKDESYRKVLYALNNYPLNIAHELVNYKKDILMISLSATLTVNNSFDATASNLGYQNMKEGYHSYDAGTVFNYRRQGILYVPDDTESINPSTDRDGHFKDYLDKTTQLIKATNGGALCLLTTRKEATLAAEHFRDNLPKSIRIISFDESTDMDALVDDFKLDVNSVLVGTRGFFQGLDLPGSTLRLVSINKVPFPPPSPISDQRREIVRRAGGDSFTQVSVVPAAQLLSQAAGRLIRHTDDRGIVAIFDHRIRTAKYGPTILNSLPPFFKTGKFSTVLSSAKSLAKVHQT
ncbi:Rad3-related DNA helicase [Actinomycetota bacterium]|nr:Rad3-related DNA helicase [Actinomycetota bacterium]